MEFGDILRQLRKERGLSQKAAAVDLGISQSLLSHYEKGIRECGLDFVVKAAAYYGVSCDYLLGRTADKAGTTISLDDIPGEEVSAKIYHMELILERIFARAKTHPEVIPDLKKLMDYYLPMTVKLLNAYADMDAQPIQGANIESAKREIEGTLDTLSRAFEKLLDELFQDTALDVSSDITVLQTLLAQEGLTDDELTKLKKENV